VNRKQRRARGRGRPAPEVTLTPHDAKERAGDDGEVEYLLSSRGLAKTMWLVATRERDPMRTNARQALIQWLGVRDFAAVETLAAALGVDHVVDSATAAIDAEANRTGGLVLPVLKGN
jgi:hypothetical protein